MSVIITPVPNRKFLSISGDIQRTMAIPLHREDDDYTIALSDGTLIHGCLDELQRHRFRVASNGAGIVRIDEKGIVVDWPIDWVTVASSGQSAIPSKQVEALPLFPEIVDDEIPW